MIEPLRDITQAQRAELLRLQRAWREAALNDVLTPSLAAHDAFKAADRALLDFVHPIPSYKAAVAS